jgi:hypothetical protein
MPNPLSFLSQYTNLLAKEIKILPATGGAVEDMQHPDPEEIEDLIINKDTKTITAFAETPEPDPQNIYRATPPLGRKQNHLYKFFIDGSIKTYFLGTGIEGQRSFPIELAQVGAALIKREDDGKLKVAQRKQKVLFLLPKQNQGISDTLWAQLNQLSKPEWLDLVDFTIPDILSENRSDPRDKAGAKARAHMHNLEIDLIKYTDQFRNENCWLILDGAVKFVEEEIWHSWKSKPYVIGVAKSFRKDPIFQFGPRVSQRKDISSILAGLPYAHRTVAFSTFDDKVAFWYVRIREQKNLDYPLMGVIKVEMPRPNKELIDAGLADLLSRALVAERNVTPYGLDRRWHCSLYPIHIAEQVIKNKFYSKEVLLGCIRWPIPYNKEK